MHTTERRERTTLLILYVLAAYIVLQVWWWGYSILQLHCELIAVDTANTTATEQHEIFRKKIWMVAGEGGVFLVMLLLGFWYIKRTVTRELQLARMEKTFLLSVTHELKTPIASIKLFLETIKTRKLDEAQSNQIINDALQETERLNILSENILLATRFDHGRGELLSEEVNMNELISQLVTRAEKINKRKILLESNENAGMRGDRELLQAMCSNLIENAVKYSNVDSTISIHLYNSKQLLQLKISDEGIGIAKDERTKIFEKFYRSGDEQTRKHKGTGLGLYIVSSVVRLHNGSITIVDNTPQGSIFILQFPHQ